VKGPNRGRIREGFNLEELDLLRVREPFVPHTIVMVSGSRYAISEGDEVSLGKSVVVVVPAKGGQHLLDPYHISELSIEDPKSWTPQTPSQN